MNILKKHAKDLTRIKKVTSLVEARLESEISRLDTEELQDLDKLLQMAGFILCKYEDRRQTHALLAEFVGIIERSAGSLESVNDQIDELALSAEGAILRIKDIQSSMSDAKPEAKKSGINLTKSSIPIYTHEYQLKQTLES